LTLIVDVTGSKQKNLTP